MYKNVQGLALGWHHKQSWKAIPVPRGRGQRGRSVPVPLQSSGGRWHCRDPPVHPARLSPALWNKPSPAKRWKRSSHDLHYLIVFSTLNLIEAAGRELHLETHKAFASVLLITGVAHFTLNISGLQLLFKWYGNCYFILKCPLSNKAKD